MAVWGSGTGSDNNNINISAGMIVAIGAWGNAGQRITAVEIKTGSYSADKTFDIYIYKGSTEDPTNMDQVGQLGSWTFDSGVSTFTVQTILSGLTFDSMDDSAWMGIGFYTADNNSTAIRGHTTSAAGDITEYEYENAAPSDPFNGGTLTDPGSLYVNVTYEAAPAASGHGPLAGEGGLAGPGGLAGGTGILVG